MFEFDFVSLIRFIFHFKIQIVLDIKFSEFLGGVGRKLRNLFGYCSLDVDLDLYKELLKSQI